MEMGEAGFAGCIQRFTVHEGDHQHVAGRGVLRDRGQQTGGIEPGQERIALFPGGHIFVIVGNRSDPFQLWPPVRFADQVCCTITTERFQNPCCVAKALC